VSHLPYPRALESDPLPRGVKGASGIRRCEIIAPQGRPAWPPLGNHAGCPYAFLKAFKRVLDDETVPEDIPFAVPYDELEKRKVKISPKVKSIRGKPNVSRERFHLHFHSRRSQFARKRTGPFLASRERPIIHAYHPVPKAGAASVGGRTLRRAATAKTPTRGRVSLLAVAENLRHNTAQHAAFFGGVLINAGRVFYTLDHQTILLELTFLGQN